MMTSLQQVTGVFAGKRSKTHSIPHPQRCWHQQLTRATCSCSSPNSRLVGAASVRRSHSKAAVMPSCVQLSPAQTFTGTAGPTGLLVGMRVH